MVSKILLGYEEAVWSKKLEINHASQILTNERQILVLSLLLSFNESAKMFWIKKQYTTKYYYYLVFTTVSLSY